MAIEMRPRAHLIRHARVQVNVKLSGINSTVDMAGVPRFAAGKTMLLGADVT